MPTPAEQKALAFIAIVIVLASAIRLSRASHPASATPAEQLAIARQASAVDSAADTPAPKGRKGRKSRKLAPESSNDGMMMSPSIQPSYPPVPVASPTAPATGYYPEHPLAPRTPYPLPNTAALPPANLQPPSRGKKQPIQPGQPIDLDLASAEEIDRLPRLGPATARRIVANRDSFGSFGSLEALHRVKGLGPATLKRLAPLVTFSGRPASSASRVPYY